MPLYCYSLTIWGKILLMCFSQTISQVKVIFIELLKTKILHYKHYMCSYLFVTSIKNWQENQECVDTAAICLYEMTM